MSIKRRMELDLPRVLYRHICSESRSKNNQICSKSLGIQIKLYRGLGRTSVPVCPGKGCLKSLTFSQVWPNHPWTYSDGPRYRYWLILATTRHTPSQIHLITRSPQATWLVTPIYNMWSTGGLLQKKIANYLGWIPYTSVAGRFVVHEIPTPDNVHVRWVHVVIELENWLVPLSCKPNQIRSKLVQIETKRSQVLKGNSQDHVTSHHKQNPIPKIEKKKRLISQSLIAHNMGTYQPCVLIFTKVEIHFFFKFQTISDNGRPIYTKVAVDLDKILNFVDGFFSHLRLFSYQNIQ